MIQLTCSECGEDVSSPVPIGTVVAAYLLCVNCLETIPESLANAFFFRAGQRRVRKMLAAADENIERNRTQGPDA